MAPVLVGEKTKIKNEFDSKSLFIKLKVFIINDGKFSSLDKDNALPYEDLGIDNILVDFFKKRLQAFGYTNYEFIKSLDDIKNVKTEFVVILNVVNPFFDPELIQKMVSRLETYPAYDLCRAVGAIPGTEPDSVLRWKTWSKKKPDMLNCLEVKHTTQERYNCQVNLRKLKRIKIFIRLVKFINGLETMPIDDVMSVLSRDEVFEKVISYFENVPLVRVQACPHCKGELEPLYATSSQPMIGFIPDSKAYHFQCVNCKLIVLSPTIPAEETYKLYDLYYREGQGQDYFLRIKSRFELYDSILKKIKPMLPSKVRGIDLGAGSGNFTRYVHKKLPSWNVVVSDFPDSLPYFKYPKHVETKPLNFLKDGIGQNEYHLVSAWEVIEHIPFQSFESLLDKIHAALKPSGIAVFSTPDFDSLLCQAWDFFNLCPPHHLLVFSESWVRKYFANHPQFELVDVLGETEIFLESDFEPWFKYWAATSKTFESRALARIFLEMLRDKKINKMLKGFFEKKRWGTSMMIIIKKK